MSEMKNGKYIDKIGNVRWYLDDQYHREDGPALEFADGTKIWYINGECHREDEPAVENADGSKHWWYLNGKRHREDGPAVEYTNGFKEWYLNDVQITEEEFKLWLIKKALNEKLHTKLASKMIIKRNKI